MSTPNQPLDLAAEAVLDPTIQFRQPRSPHAANPQHILLTGATGFLGAYLLHELLQQTSAQIHCLVRASDDVAAMQRLHDHLVFYKIWDDAYANRVVPIIGDLAKPQLGLTEATLERLAAQIDMIVHNGALVNIVFPYAKSKVPNVLGTQEILRLAARTQTKPVHYISTMGIFFAQKVERVYESDLPLATQQRNGYQQSKWVAEELIRLAQARGLPASIYRAVRIMGHSQTGIIGNFDDFLFLILQGCIQVGKFPAVDGVINFVPMDYASQAIVHIAKQEAALGKSFHLAHQKPTTWRELFERIRTLGYALEGVSYEEWSAAINQAAAAQPDNETFMVLQMIGRIPNNIFAPKPAFDDANTQAALASGSPLGAISCPPVDEALLTTYFNYFHQQAFIPAPMGSRTVGQ